MANPNPNQGGWIAVGIFCLLFTTLLLGGLMAIPDSKVRARQQLLDHANLTPPRVQEAYRLNPNTDFLNHRDKGI
jgi:hypothetical protein